MAAKKPAPAPAHPSNKVASDNVSVVVRPRLERGLGHSQIADAAEALILTILAAAPDCADRAAAIRAAREAQLWANAAMDLAPDAF